MITQASVLNGFKKIFLGNKVVSISGESGTGKTTLAQYLIGNLLTISKPYEDYCFWIQASEAFSKKRLIKMFTSNSEKLRHLNNNILISPSNKACSSFSEQSELLRKISRKDYIFPPNLKFIVIDNISHHLRYEISKSNDIKIVMSKLNAFFDSELMPLIMTCQRENITLLLIHESSFNPALNQNMPFFYKLYTRINTIDINLTKGYTIDKKIMKITSKDQVRALSYRIDDKGIKILN